MVTTRQIKILTVDGHQPFGSEPKAALFSLFSRPQISACATSNNYGEAPHSDVCYYVFMTALAEIGRIAKNSPISARFVILELISNAQAFGREPNALPKLL